MTDDIDKALKKGLEKTLSEKNRKLKREKNKKHIKKLEDSRVSKLPCSLDDVYCRLRKWLFIPDIKWIDLVLATAISNQARDAKPIWMFLVGRSGDGKSEIIKGIDGFGNTLLIDQITKNTFATGMVYKGKKVYDIGEDLQDKSTLLLISDLASLKSVNKDAKNEIFGQFREMYDGDIRKNTGSGVKTAYKNCHITFIACSTPDIKAEYSIHNILGTREFAYDIESDRKYDDEKMKLAMSHIGREAEMKKDIKNTLHGFLEGKKFNYKIELSENSDLYKWLTRKCIELSVFRAAVSYERNTGKVRDFIFPEVPTRILQQLVLLYKSLKSLDIDYPIDKFKDMINNIIRSSGDPVRQRVFYYVHENQPSRFSVRQLHEIMDIGERTIHSQCETLTAMGYFTREIVEEYYGANMNLTREVTYYSWNMNKNKQDKLKLYGDN